MKKIIALCLIIPTLFPSHETIIQKTPVMPASTHVLDIVSTIKPIQAIIAGYLDIHDQLAHTIPLDSVASSVALSPFNKYAVIASNCESVKIFDIAQNKFIDPLKHSDKIQHVMFSPDGTYLMAHQRASYVNAPFYYGVTVWHFATRHKIETFRHYIRTWRAQFSPDSKKIAYTHTNSERESTRLVLFNLENGIISPIDNTGLYSVQSCAFSPDSKYFAIGYSGAGKIKIHDMITKKVVTSLDCPNGVREMAFSPDGTLLAAETNGAVINLQIWDIQTRKIVHTLQDGSNQVCLRAFSPDKKRLVSCSQIWDLNTGKKTASIETSYNGISPDGKFMAVSDWNSRSIKICDANTGSLLHENKRNPILFEAVVYSPDGIYLAIISRDKFVTLWKNQASDLK